MNVTAILKDIIKSLRRILQFRSHDESTATGTSDERYRRIIFSGGTALIVKIVSVSMSLISVPLTIHYLGAERYGLWMAISSVMTLMNFADFGLGNGLLNVVAQAKGKNDVQAMRIAVSSTFFMLSAVALTLLILFVSLYNYIKWERFFNVHSTVAIEEAGPTMCVLVGFLLLNIPLNIIQRIREGHQEGFIVQMWLLAGTILSFILLLFCIKFKCGLPILASCYSIGPIIALLFNGYFLLKKRHAQFFPSLGCFDLKLSKKLLSTGLIFFVLNVFTLLANSTDDIVIAQVLGAKAIASFEIVKKLFLFSMVTQFVIQPLWPAFAEALAKGDIFWIKRAFKKIMVLSLVSSGIIALPLLLAGKYIVRLWVGEAFIPSWSLLGGFYAFVYLANYGGVMSTFLNSDNSLLKKQTIMVGLSAISALILKIFLSRYMGVSGIIWATIIGYCCFYIVPSYRLSIKSLAFRVEANT